jgi:outer membrane protein assembly factor BamA
MEARKENRENQQTGQMRTSSAILLLFIFVMLQACSNTRFLTEDQVLYTGRKDITIISPKKVENTKSAKNTIKSVSSYKVNNALFNKRVLPPIGLWVHNYIRVKENRKFRKWLRKTLASSPVLISDVNPELRAKKIENELFDKGYFQNRAWASVDTSARNPKKAKVSYFVELTPPYKYNLIKFDSIAEPVDSLISQEFFKDKIKSRDQFDLNVLKNARNDLSRKIQDNGFFYFIPEFIELRADTSLENNTLNLEIGRKQELPQTVLSVYRINNTLINLTQPSDTTHSTTDTAYFDDITIVSGGDILKPDILLNSVSFSKGDIYSYDAYQYTINRLNSLGIFNFVKISFMQSPDDSLGYLLDVRIDLVMAENINVDFEADMVSKSTGYSGPAVSVGISHGNVFKGAEKLHLTLKGGFEWQWGTKSETQLGAYSYEFGVGSGLTFPKIIIPFKEQNKKNLVLQKTSVNGDLNILNRTAYYKMFSAKTNLNYQWGKKTNITHSFYPLYINSVNVLETTAEFDSVVNDNIYIRKSFEEQFILGPKYDFSFNNTLKIRPNNFIVQAGIGTSGALIDVFASMGKGEDERPYYFMNNIYSQYVKVSTDFRYYRNGFNKSLVFRFYAGIGMPYGNSDALPYVEQFFSGGAYSIRGFTSRTLGPGAYHEVDNGYIDQSGDLKLESNLEFRFGMSKTLKGALFLETGNIWLVNEDPNRPGSKFHLDSFVNQLAVGSGFGLRFDFTFFVLRTDIGLPLRTAYIEDNRNWLFGTDKIFSGALFHLAIGYPF